jgi:1-acyl-sn-glycerol-3-phosphate acyltransferase
MPGWRVTVKGVENVPPEGQAAVLVANHESMADIWGMFFLKTQFRWLSKASVFKIPMVGPAMKWAGYVPIERGERASHSNAMTAAADRLKMGLKMFYFPEGTRSSDGQIKPFKMGAFRLAQEAQVPVVPIAIHGAAELMTKGSGLPGRSHVHIIVLPALPPPAPNEASLPDYAERVRQSIIAVHADLT